jgi:uncharacterized protein (TIGR03437 family)
LTALALLGLASLRFGPQPAFRQNSHKHPTARVYGNLPLAFEPNEGQAETGVKFLARGPGYSLSLAEDQAVLALHSASGRHLLGLKLVGANTAAKLTGEEKLPGKSNYFIGNDPSKWRTNLPNYAKVRYQQVYPGVDVVYYGNQQQLEYDFVVAPGADPHSIQLAFEGADKLEVDERGDLLLWASGSALRMKKPLVYQQSEHERQEIAGNYFLDAKRSVGFHVGPYDPHRALVIDPALVNVSCLPSLGVFGAGIRAAEFDSAGNLYVTGSVLMADYRHPPDSAYNAFVGKFSAAGSLLYKTYLGGNQYDVGYAVAMDRFGNAYVTGATASSNFPAASAIQAAWGGGTTCSRSGGETSYLGPCEDAFVTKLNPSGDGILYSTFLGGSGKDMAFAIALDQAGNAFVTGGTSSRNFPVTANALRRSCGTDGNCNATVTATYSDAFVSKLNADASALLYSSYLGGSANDQGNAIAVDSEGNAFIAGSASPGFPTTPGAFQTAAAQGGAFVTKLKADGSALLYSTYLANAKANAVAVDPGGSVYVTGSASAGFPTTSDAFQPVFGGPPAQTGYAGTDAFVSKLNPDGSGLVYSTYLGGKDVDSGSAMVLDAAGNIYVAGTTSATSSSTVLGGFPVVNPLQTFANGYSDAFITKLTAAGRVVFSTYLGGDSGGSILGMAIDPTGDIVLAAQGRVDPACDGNFLARIGLATNPVPTLTSLSPASVKAGTAGFTLTVSGWNFLPNSVVRWNGADRATSSGGLSRLWASIPAADITATGTAQVTVFTPAPGGGTSAPLTVTMTGNPVPVLSSLKPASAAVGGPGFLLTVNGTGFVTGATLRWNGVDRPSNLASGGLVSSILAGDVAAPGIAQVTVANPPPGGGVSNVLPFTIWPTPAVNAGGVVNGASFGAQVAAGSIASVFGTGLAPAIQAADKLPLPTTLGAISVSVNGFAAPLFYVSPLQINFQVPWEAGVVAQPVSTVTVTVNGVASAPQTFSLSGIAPGLFAVNPAGQGAVLISATGELAAPTGSISGRAARPAQRGEYISIYCTGLGAVTNQPASGAAAGASSTTTATPGVTIGGMPAPVTFSGLAPSFVGLYQVNVQVPDSAAPGSAVPVVLTIGSVTSNTVTIAVQ